MWGTSFISCEHGVKQAQTLWCYMTGDLAEIVLHISQDRGVSVRKKGTHKVICLRENFIAFIDQTIFCQVRFVAANVWKNMPGNVCKIFHPIHSILSWTVGYTRTTHFIKPESSPAVYIVLNLVNTKLFVPRLTSSSRYSTHFKFFNSNDSTFSHLGILGFYLASPMLYPPLTSNWKWWQINIFHFVASTLY